MIEVLIFGQPRWGSQIAKSLNERATDVRAAFIPQASYLRLLARPPRSRRVVIMRAGFRLGGATPRGRLFDTYWAVLRRSLPAAVPCHYWLGTDVLDTIEEAAAGTLRSRTLSATRDELHIAAAPWLVSELESVGVRAVTAYVPGRILCPDVVAPLPAEFRVLTYLPTARFDFYGGQTILEVARRLPDIRFDVVGSGGAPSRTAPANIRWHGWVADMSTAYTDATVVVRIPRHDAIGGSVIEGLLHARHAIYTYGIPFVRTVSPVTSESVVEAIREFHDAHAAGRLELNMAGRAYALEEFDETGRVDRVLELLRARA